MMVDPIDPALARKLDLFTVPGLPADFGAAVVARAIALPPAPPSTGFLPRSRRTARGRWWRGGVVGIGLATAGMMSVAAAASGWFGEPIREAVEQAPVIGAVIAKVAPGPAPAEAALSRQAPGIGSSQPGPVPEVAPVGEPIESLGPRTELRRRMADKLTHDPEKREWLEAHPRVAARLLRNRARHDPALRAEIRQSRERWRAERGRPPLNGRQGFRTTPDQPDDALGARRTPRMERIKRLRERREERLERLEPVDRISEKAGDAEPMAALAPEVDAQPASALVPEAQPVLAEPGPVSGGDAARRLRRERIRALRARAASRP